MHNQKTKRIRGGFLRLASYTCLPAGIIGDLHRHNLARIEFRGHSPVIGIEPLKIGPWGVWCFDRVYVWDQALHEKTVGWRLRDKLVRPDNMRKRT